jgi:DNA-binding phage protein
MTDNEFDPVKIADLKPWKASDYLDTDDMIVAYLQEALDSEHLTVDQRMTVLCSSICDVIEALQKRKA